MRHVAIVSVRVVMDSYDAEDAALTAAQHLQDAGFNAVASTVSGVRYGMEHEVSEEFDAPTSHLPAERNDGMEGAPRYGDDRRYR